MQKEMVVSLADLRYVCVNCPGCRTKVILDMEELSEFARKYGMWTLKECPGCHVAYDSAIQPGVNGLQKAYESLIAIADRISFHGTPEGAVG